MTKSELIELLLKRQPHLKLDEVENGVKNILEIIAVGLANHERVEIRGFGSFSLHHRPARKGRNPKTGQTVYLPDKYAVHFKPGKELRERIIDLQPSDIESAE